MGIRDSDIDGVARARQRFAWQRLSIVREAGDTHFWHGPRRRLLLDLLLREGVAGRDGPLLDAGCGDGRLVQALLGAGIDAHGVDPWAGTQGLDPARFRTAGVEDLPWPDASFATACALDVIEHVDDGIALAELHRVLRPRGRLLVSVPAHEWLWSARDVAAGHRRRYTRRSLRTALGNAGFAIERVFGFQALLLPLALASRVSMRRRGADADTSGEDRPPAWLNGLLRGVNGAEVALGRVVRPPTGSSLLAVARRLSAPVPGNA